VTADELCGGVDDDVGAVLDWPAQVRCGEGVVNDQRRAVLVLARKLQLEGDEARYLRAARHEPVVLVPWHWC
jgi:hypothetical protein